MWDYARQFIHILNNEQFVIVLKGKQLGFSTMDALDTLTKVLTQKSYSALFLSRGQLEASQLLDKAKFAYSYLPTWFSGRTESTPTKWSGQEICFDFMENSRILAFPCTENPGLGMTGSRGVLDEWDFFEYPEPAFATVQAALSSNGQIVIQSTRNKANTNSMFLNFYNQAKQGLNGFKAFFFGYDVRPDRDEKWYEAQKYFYIDRPWQMEENNPRNEAEALSPMSAMSFFDKDVLKRIYDNCRKPIEERENGVIKIWSTWRTGVTYVAAEDASQGVGGDAQCLMIAGKQGLSSELVAVIHSSHITPDVFAAMAVQLLKEYKSPIIAPESNSIGQVFISELLNHLDYHNIFYSDKERTKPGIFTSGQHNAKFNKETMLTELSTSLRTGELITYYQTNVEELMKFQFDNSGKLKASSGHDDTVMCLAILNQLLKTTRSPIIGKPQKSRIGDRTTVGMYE